MKSIIILTVCVVACAAEYYTLPKDPYTPEKLRNDHVEIKERMQCLLDKQPCTALTVEYRKIADDIVNNCCAKCSPELKALIQAFFVGAKEKYPAEYKELILKYDTTLTKFNDLEEAVGVLKTILSSLTSIRVPPIPLLPSLTSWHKQ